VETTAQDRYYTRTGAPSVEIPRLEPVVYGTTGDGPLDEKALRDYDRDGYLVVPDLLPDDDVRRLRTELGRLLTAPELAGDERVITEPGSTDVRSIFAVHVVSPVLRDLAADGRVAGIARQLLGSPVYLHQTRANYKPGFTGRDFYWHSDFETWHCEDGMPAMRALSVSISLTDNYDFNGPLMVMPGSHRTYVTGSGSTPQDNYKRSLKDQEVGVPDQAALTALADRYGIRQFTGPAGGAIFFDCNLMHGSNGNITPYPRSNLFFVYNSVHNTLREPFGVADRRPGFLGARDFTAVGAGGAAC
jgi:ectoine hydroxylase